jgi:hypothetical protein
MDVDEQERLSNITLRYKLKYEKQTTQWRKEKIQKDKQWSTKHTYKTKDRVTRTPLKSGGEHSNKSLLQAVLIL